MRDAYLLLRERGKVNVHERDLRGIITSLKKEREGDVVDLRSDE